MINRTKIDEALVSLRLMKQIEVFLETNKISLVEFAEDLEVSIKYINKLMDGSKHIDIVFINKFEKKYLLEIKFTI